MPWRFIRRLHACTCRRRATRFARRRGPRHCRENRLMAISAWFSQQQHDPTAGRMPGCVVGQDAPPVVPDHEKAVEQAEGHRRNGRERVWVSPCSTLKSLSAVDQFLAGDAIANPRMASKRLLLISWPHLRHSPNAPASTRARAAVTATSKERSREVCRKSRSLV